MTRPERRCSAAESQGGGQAWKSMGSRAPVCARATLRAMLQPEQDGREAEHEVKMGNANPGGHQTNWEEERQGSADEEGLAGVARQTPGPHPACPPSPSAPLSPTPSPRQGQVLL